MLHRLVPITCTAPAKRVGSLVAEELARLSDHDISFLVAPAHNIQGRVGVENTPLNLLKVSL